MSTSSTVTVGAISLYIDWHESTTDTALSYAPEVIATSSGAYGDSYIITSWDLTVDGVTVSSGTGDTDYYGSGTGRGPYTVDTFMSREVARTYGSTHTIRLVETFSDWYGAGSAKRITIDKTLAVPARPYQTPAAPSSLTATRQSDAAIALSWTNNATTAAPYDLIIIERAANGGAWESLTTVADSATGYTDSSVGTDSSYVYRVAAQNSTGPGSYSATAGPVLTTPAAPGTPTASKVSATSVRLTMTNTSAIAESLEVQRSTDGGTTWSNVGSAQGVVTTYTDTAAPAAAAVVYRVHNVAGALASAWSAASNSIAVLAAPYAPTITTTANQAVAIGPAASLSWQFNSSDGSSQTAYEARTSTDNGTTWSSTGKVTSTASSYSLATSGLTDGAAVLWQVRTWGLYTDPSPWSSVGSVVAYTAPTVALTSPSANPYTITALPLVVAWTFSDGSRPQGRAAVQVTDADSAVVASGTIYGTETSLTLTDWQPANQSNYTLALTVTSSSGLAVTLSCALVVNYVAPAIPSATITEAANKALAIVVHEGQATGSELATDSLAVYRVAAGVSTLLADGMSDGDSVTDYLPPMDEQVIYRVVALSSTNLSSTAEVPYTLASHGWLVLNYGEAWSQGVAIKYNVTYSETFEDDGELWYGAGSADPVLIVGSQRSKAASASGLILASQRPALRAFADGWHKPAYVRAPGGLKAKVRATVSMDSPHTLYSNVSVDMRRLS